MALPPTPDLLQDQTHLVFAVRLVVGREGAIQRGELVEVSGARFRFSRLEELPSLVLKRVETLFPAADQPT